ncbi:MAG: glutamate racemase [Candidatus Glassbacteria bacterium]|nr:glutamate racemase [Candidatus Glassbacteria bacterium]
MIGVFDSGVGGLAILREIEKRLPRADITYLADTEAFPYGSKSPEFVTERCTKITRLLIERGAQVIVLACNTATVVAIEHLRKTFEVPFVGVEPAVKVAAGGANPGPIYVLMTANTAAGGKYAALVERHAGGRTVRPVVIGMLAAVVEDGSFRQEEVAAEIRRQVRAELGDLPPGSLLVLGCTHYIFLKELLQETLGEGVEILEPSKAVAKQVEKVSANSLSSRETSGECKITLFFTSRSRIPRWMIASQSVRNVTQAQIFI